MDGFSLQYRLDRNRNGVGVMIFVKEDIPSKLLTKDNFSNNVEGLFVKLNFNKMKMASFGTCHAPAENDRVFFFIVSIKLLMLTVTMIKFYLEEILVQKMMSLAINMMSLSINMISIIL